MMYYYVRSYYPTTLYPVYIPVREQLPPVNIEFFYESANETVRLMNDVRVVLNKLSTSKEFDRQIMSAAQQSDHEEVKRLIQSLNITSTIEVGFTPDELRLNFSKKTVHSNRDCCKITIFLRWR
ncbi:hypothetical protein ACW0KB_00400 [Virgibacillus salarius]|nr:hypothetical protein [Priestia megaterium]